MRKFLYLIFLAAVLAPARSTFAQSPWLGIKGGLSIPDLSGGGNNPLSNGWTSRLAANFGLQYECTLHNNLGLQVELNYAGQGGKRDGMQPITNLPPSLASQVPPGTYLYADFDNKAILDYLELPVMAKLSWGKTLGFYVNAGPYVGYLLSAKEKTSGTSTIYEDSKGQMPLTVQGYPVPPQDFTSTTDVTSSIKRWNVGITGGAGLSWRLDRSDKLFLDARFEYGLINIQRYSDDGTNNTGNVLFSLGYAHKFR